MTKLKLLSATLIATAMLATPAMARKSHVTSRHLVLDANASASPTARYVDGRVCIPSAARRRICYSALGREQCPLRTGVTLSRRGTAKSKHHENTRSETAHRRASH
jgi:hypothetical protein